MYIVRSLILSMLIVSSSVWAGPEKDLQGNDIFSDPNKQFDFGKLKGLKKSDTLFIPFVELKLQYWGTQGSVAQTGGFRSSTQTAQARSTLTTVFDPALVQELATQMHQDVIQKMRSEGWKVITLDDVKTSKHYKKLKWKKTSDLGPGLEIDKKKDGKVLGVGMADSAGASYVTAVPKGQELLKYGITGPGWSFKKIGKEFNANVVVPQYTVNTLYFAAEGKKGIFGNSATAKVESGPLVSLAHAGSGYLNPKQYGGYSTLKQKGANAHTGVTGGKVVSVKDTSSKTGNALGAFFKATGGAGISSSKNEQVVESDEAQLKAESLKLVAAYNDVLARAYGLYLKK